MTFVHTSLLRCILTLSFFLLFASVSEAKISYSVTPLIIDEKVEARDILEYSISLVNNGDVPVTIYPTVNNISIGQGGSIEAFLPPVMSDQTTSLSSWIEINRGGIDLMAGETHVATLTLRVNPNAKPGEYHAFIGFPFGGNRDEAERKLQSGEAPGTVVSVTLEDKRLSLLKVSTFVIDRFVTEEGNTALSYVVRNPGEEPLTPGGEVIFYNGRGEEVGFVRVNPEAHILLPGEERIFKAEVPTKGLFGKYKGFLSIEYGNANIASIQDTTFFYVIPLKTLLLLFGGVLLVVMLVSFQVHRRYFDEYTDDGSELVPLHVRDGVSSSAQHDIDLRTK